MNNLNKINYQIFKLDSFKTDNKPGTLYDFDLKKICKNFNLQFQITKAFYITDLNSNGSRGNHSNCNCSEILICISENFDILLNNGYTEKILTINKGECIFIDKNTWIVFNNFKNCIIFAFVDIDHNEDKKSIYNFEEFQNYIKNKS
jgi:hypothetical protein